MKRSRFTDSQILAVLKQAEVGTAVPDLCREHGISTATFYKWRSKYGGMDVCQATPTFYELRKLDLPALSKSRSLIKRAPS